MAPALSGGGCSDGLSSGTGENLAATRAAHRLADLDVLALRRRAICRMLPDEFREDHLDLRLGCAATGTRARRADGAARLVLYPGAWSADLGHDQYRNRRHVDCRGPRNSSCLLCRAQHDTERGSCASDRAVHYRFIALDQRADLGAHAGHDNWSG